MSLLLDALKKAADDKQKASRSGIAGVERLNTASADDKKNQALDAGKALSSAEELSLQAQDNPESLSINDDEIQELTLETDEADADISSAVSFDSNDLKLDEMVSVHDELDEKESNRSGQRKNKKSKEAQSESLTVSDDALSLLIYKTNRDVKRGRKILFVTVFMASTAIIAFAGIYYYLDMQAEIAALERKHQIELKSMQSKTTREKAPEKTAIIRNLVSDAGLDEKVQFAKKAKKAHGPAKITAEMNKETARNERKVNVTTGVMSLQRTNKSDPVGEKLDAAWQEYGDGQYNEAKLLYEDVLNIEKNNRDALLGLGAIAVLEKNNPVAREIYLSLLKLDPRDPIATAAMASLQSEESTLKTDEEYMLAMQQKNPDEAHLNFALANIYAQQGKWKTAQQYYFNAWQLDIENADYIYNLAVSMDQLKKQPQAISFYKDSLLKSANKHVSFSRESVEKRIKELSGL
jgi:tetratricopeptide (TPR) repeat protein